MNSATSEETTLQFIATLEKQLAQIREVIRAWEEKAQDLAQSAAEARAKNQAAGRGLGGMLFGAKYRGMARRVAAMSNAGIAQQVSANRATVIAGKKDAKLIEQNIKTQLVAAQASLKMIRSHQKGEASIPGISSELSRLWKLTQDGALTTDEFAAEKARLIARELPAKEAQQNSVDILDNSEADETYQRAIRIVAESQKASTSYLQRQLRIGYSNAAHLIERMEKDGYVGIADHVGRREVLIGLSRPTGRD